MKHYYQVWNEVADEAEVDRYEDYQHAIIRLEEAAHQSHIVLVRGEEFKHLYNTRNY